MNEKLLETIKLRSLNTQRKNKSIFLSKIDNTVIDFSLFKNYVLGETEEIFQNTKFVFEFSDFKTSSKTPSSLSLKEKIKDKSASEKERLIIKENNLRRKILLKLKSINNLNSIKKQQEGENQLNIGFYFLEGKLEDMILNAPLIFFETKIKFANDGVVELVFDKKPKHNVSLISLISSKNNKIVKDFFFENNIDGKRESFKEIIKELKSKYNDIGLNLNHFFKDENLGFSNLVKIEIPKKEKIQTLNLKKQGIFGMFSSADTYIYNDISAIIKDKEWTKDFLDLNKKMDRTFSIEKYNASFKESDILLFGSLDLYQQNATKLALEKSPTLIQGPPGTGKTQTILNIALNIIANKKRLLIVSEKKTALDVIWKRLNNHKNLQPLGLNLSLKKEDDIFYDQFIILDSILNSNFVKMTKKKLNYEKQIASIKELNELSDKKIGNFSFEEMIEFLSVYEKNTLSQMPNKNIKWFEKNIDILFSDATWVKKCVEIFDWIKKLKYGLTFDFIDKVNDFNEKNLILIVKNYLKKEQWETNVELKKDKKIKNYSNVLTYLQKQIVYYKTHKLERFNFDKYERDIRDSMILLYKNNFTKVRKKIVIEYFEKYNLLKDFKSSISFSIDKNIKFNKQLQSLHELKESIIKNNIEYLYNELGLEIIKKYKKYKNEINLLIKTSFMNKKRKPSYWIKKNYKILSQIYPMVLATSEDVSEFIPLNEKFDYVIFDESSQVFLEKAIPSIYRGSKIVLFGDQKQLRPTSFFDVRNEAVENEDDEISDLDYDLLNTESILDYYNNNIKEKTMLKGHYRSKSSDLIEFSSKEFYDDELWFENFVNRDKVPIELIDVKGSWIDNKNIEEAEAVIAKIEELVEDKNIYKKKSIGVITFNSKQKDLMIEKLYSSENSKLADILNWKSSEGEDLSLFIKNIEEVQGDERDIIIFSVGYSDSVTNYGPVSQVGGENRINVAVTRAKEKIILVKSFPANSYYGLKSSMQGPKKFIKYLKFIEEKIPQETIIKANKLKKINNIFENKKSLVKKGEVNDFILEVSQYLKNKVGVQYTIKPYKGISEKINIDLVIEKDNNPVLALIIGENSFENDYQLREKYIFQQEFLMSRGWKIYRINKFAWEYNKDSLVLEINNYLKDE